MTTARVLKDLKKQREEVLRDLNNVALTLPAAVQLELNAKLRELVAAVPRLRAEYERRGS